MAGVFLLVQVVALGDVGVVVPMAALGTVMITVPAGTLDWHSIRSSTPTADAGQRHDDPGGGRRPAADRPADEAARLHVGADAPAVGSLDVLGGAGASEEDTGAAAAFVTACHARAEEAAGPCPQLAWAEEFLDLLTAVAELSRPR